MKKNLLILILVMVLTIVTVSLASANAGPHGDYTATTDKCAGCHRAHTAIGPRLLVAETTDDLCLTCHGHGVTGATTDVVNGYLEDGTPADTTNKLLGGGFDNYGGSAVTSEHDLGETLAWSLTSTGTITATVQTAALIDSASLSCASCHDPHGSANYRIIKTAVNSASNNVVVPDTEAAKDYYTEDWDYGFNDGAANDFDAGISQLCAACHARYHATASGSGSAADLYAHRIDMPWDAVSSIVGSVHPETGGLNNSLYLADDYMGPDDDDELNTVDDDIALCTTCHFAHGSAASVGTYSEAATQDGKPSTGANDDSSALLRLDNRGVCQACHQKDYDAATWGP